MHFIIAIFYAIFGLIFTIGTLTLLTLPGIIEQERKYYKLATLYAQQPPEPFENPAASNNPVPLHWANNPVHTVYELSLLIQHSILIL